MINFPHAQNPHAGPGFFSFPRGGVGYVREGEGWGYPGILSPGGATEELCRWIVSFPVATRNFLRNQPTELMELEGSMAGGVGTFQRCWIVGIVG